MLPRLAGDASSLNVLKARLDGQPELMSGNTAHSMGLELRSNMELRLELTSRSFSTPSHSMIQ